MGAMKGTLLGLANTFVIAAAIAASEPRPSIGIFILVVIYGFIPGMMTGVVLGIIADLLRVRPALRIAILLVPAVAMVALLGGAFELDQLVLPACIPTAVGILILERSTRPPAPDIPEARTM
jgi:hypothetical protein